MWNSKPNFRCRTETIRGHLKKNDFVAKFMQTYLVLREKVKRCSYFAEQEKKFEQKNVESAFTKVFSTLCSKREDGSFEIHIVVETVGETRSR